MLKSGGAYVPIDPELPLKRKEHIIKDTKASLVLSHSALEDQLPSNVMKIIRVDKMENYTKLKTSNLNTKMNSGNLAYVIYTSGSTGVPKGVLCEHISLVNRTIWMKNEFKFNDERILVKTSISFVDSVYECIGSVVNGCALIITSYNYSNSDIITSIMDRFFVTQLIAVPEFLSLFQRNNKYILP